MIDTIKQQSWVALCCALGMSLGAAGCRPLLPEAGLAASVYTGQLGLASNVLGQWYVVLPESMWPEREQIRYVVVTFDGQRKLFYAKNNGPRSVEILPISPTPDQWLQRASSARKIGIKALTDLSADARQIKGLSDPIGYRQPNGQVRWLGAVRPGKYVGNLWRVRLPKDRQAWTIEKVLGGVAHVEVNAENKTQATPWRQSKWSIAQRAAFVVLEGRAPTEALRVAVDGADASLNGLADPKTIKLIGARPQEEDKTKRTSVSWTMRQRLAQDNAQLYLRYGELRSDLFAMRPIKWTSPVHMTPSWLEHPIQFKLLKTTTLIDIMMGYHALLEGMPVAAMQMMPKSGVVFKQNSGHWRHTALLGMAHYTPWMRQGLRQGKTHWQAPDRVYGALGYLYDGAFQRAEDEASRALEGFKRWKGSARELGKARAYALLVHALAGQGRYKAMLAASKEAVLLYRKQGDAIHAAQVEWDTAIYAHHLKQPDAAVLLAQRARSRFYYANAAHPCAQVELFLAQLYLALNQPKRARQMADYAVARMKYIKDAVGLNRARIVSLLIDDRLDPLRSPSFGLEEAFDAAGVLHDVQAQSLAATGLMLHRSLTRPELIKRYLEIMPTGLPTSVEVHTPDVWRSVYIACASLGRDLGLSDPEFDRLNSESRYCQSAQNQVHLDRALVAALTRRMKVARLANQQQVATGQARALLSLLKAPSSSAWVKSHPVDVAMAYAIAAGVLSDSQWVEDAQSTLDVHLDPLLRAKAYARVASAADGAPWRAIGELMWKRALNSALKAKQYDLWSTLLIERATQLNFRQSPITSSVSTKLNPRDRLMHEAMAAASTGKPVQLPATSVLSVLDHIEVHTLEAHYAASHAMSARLAQKIKRIRQLEAGLSRQLLSTARAKLLAGQVMALDAQLAWQQLDRREAWRRAQRALALLAEDDTPRIVRARARAVLLMGLSARSDAQRRVVDRELARLTASDRRSAHRLHEVLGWRMMALIAYERGQNKESILAMKRLASLGYALSPYGEVYGCGQVQMRFGFESVDSALDRAVICLQSNASTILAPQMALFALIHQPNKANRHASLQKALNTYAQAPDGPQHNAWTKARAAYIAAAVASSGPLTPAAKTQLEAQQRSLEASSGPSQWSGFVTVCQSWLAHHQFKQAAACIQALEARIKSIDKKASLPASIEVMALRAQYNNLRLLPQQNLYTQVPVVEKKASNKTTSRGLMALHQALMLSALMNGQHQLASTHLEQIITHASVLGDAARVAQTQALAKSLGLSPAMDTVR